VPSNTSSSSGFNNDAFLGKPAVAKKTVKKMAFADSDEE